MCSIIDELWEDETLLLVGRLDVDTATKTEIIMVQINIKEDMKRRERSCKLKKIVDAELQR